jgi:type II secretory pathway component GspD/PulD (secretin)
MKQLTFVFAAWCALGNSVALSGDVSPGEAIADITQESGADSQKAGIEMAKIIDAVARKTGRKFLVDPKLHVQVQLIGEELNHITYPEMLTILQLNGFAAVETGGFILVVPETNVRVMPTPEISNKQTLPDSEYVSVIIPVISIPAGRLVPILRPLMPTYAHLAATPCSNSILMVDTYANVRRIEGLIKTLDAGDPYRPAKCEWPIAKAEATRKVESP